jgi:hypothetical protein
LKLNPVCRQIYLIGRSVMAKAGKAIILYMTALVITLISPVSMATEKVMNDAAQKIITGMDHSASADYYEDIARQMMAKIREQKALREQYLNKSYLYGRQAQDLQAQTYARERQYEKLAKVNSEKAALHRQMALRGEEDRNINYLEK